MTKKKSKIHLKKIQPTKYINFHLYAKKNQLICSKLQIPARSKHFMLNSIKHTYYILLLLLSKMSQKEIWIF